MSRHLALALIASAGLAGAAHAFDNEPDGFRGIPFGASIADYESELLKQNERPTGEVVYVRRGDKMSIGEAKLDQLQYVFYKGRFYGARIGTSGQDNKFALIRTFNAQFGRGDRPNRYLDEYFWRGSQAHMLISCPPASGRHICAAQIASRELMNEATEDRKRAAERSGSDF